MLIIKIKRYINFTLYFAKFSQIIGFTTITKRGVIFKRKSLERSKCAIFHTHLEIFTVFTTVFICRESDFRCVMGRCTVLSNSDTCMIRDGEASIKIETVSDTRIYFYFGCNN